MLAAQLAALEAVAPGSICREVDAVAREIIAAAGHGEHFGHGLGHGVGMEIHEGPRLARVSGTAPLEAGNVVTVEPGVYLPGRFGVRIEDLVAVVPGGHDRLSAFPKELLTVKLFGRRILPAPDTVAPASRPIDQSRVSSSPSGARNRAQEGQRGERVVG